MTKTPVNIFDLENTNDLPNSLNMNLKKNKFKGNAYLILSLFDIKPILTVDEIMVGLFRKDKIELERKIVSSTVNNIMAKGFLKRVAPCTYEKVIND